MEVPQLLIFDDARGRWGPMTDRRPVFDLRTGAATTRQRIERMLGRPAVALHVADHLAEVCRARAVSNSQTVINQSLTPGSWLLVNGRWNGVQHAALVAQLAPGHALIEADGDVVAVCLEHGAAQAMLDRGAGRLPEGVTATALPDRVLLGRPWHVLDELPAALEADLHAATLPAVDAAALPGVYVMGDHPVRLGEGARLLPGAVLNAEAGPIVIDEQALVHPFVSIQGPCYIGAHTVIAAHTSLRPHTVIGPHCKVGGEVSAAIIHGHSNKAHLGYLGNSLVGEWCNLGADTNMSNMKNTYGPVRVQLDSTGETEDSGRMFHGPIIGDLVCTAIGTRVLTGSVIHTGCMLALSSYAPKHTEPFGFYTDAGRSPYGVEQLLTMVRRMLARRGDVLSDTEAALLRALHERADKSAAELGETR